MKKFFTSIKNYIDSQIDYIEKVEITPLTFMATFFSIVMIRVFVENFSNPDQYGLFAAWSTIITYTFFYSALLLTAPIVIAPFSGKKPLEILRFSIFSSVLLIIPPVIDLLLTGGKGFCIGYNGAHHMALVKSFFLFFGPLQNCAVSIGMRIEIIIILIGIFFFCYKNTKKISTSLLGSLAGYSVAWAYLSMPGILMTLDPRTFSFESIENYFATIYSGSLFSSVHTFFSFQVPPLFHYFEFIAFLTGRIDLWLSLAALVIIFWKYDKKKVKAFFSNIRPARIGLNLLFMGLGIKLAFWMGFVKQSLSLTDLFGLLTLCLVIGLNFILAVVINDLYDESIDEKSNANRPLIQKTLSRDDMKFIGHILAVFVFMGALQFNYNVFVLLLSFQMIYFIYSVPPLRLRRIFPINSFVIGFVSVLSLMAGFFFISANQEIVSFPKAIMLLFFIFIISISPAKDLKDISGDEGDGVVTLPSLIGFKKSRLITGLIMLAWLLFFIFIIISYSPVVTFIYGILFICAVVGLFLTKEGERGGFILLYSLIIPLFFI